MNAPQTIILDRTIWTRGQLDTRGTFLLHAQAGPRGQCCLGIAMTALGVPDELLKGRRFLIDLRADFDTLPAPAREFLSQLWDVVDPQTPSPEAHLYSCNDGHPYLDDLAPGMPDKVRVQKLNLALERWVLPIRFALKEVI